MAVYNWCFGESDRTFENENSRGDAKDSPDVDSQNS